MKTNSLLIKTGILLLYLTVMSCADWQEPAEIIVKSPDNNHSFTLKIDSVIGVVYRVDYKEKKVVGESSLGFDGLRKTSRNIKIESTETKSVSSLWKPIYGERNEYPVDYNETFVMLSGNDARYNLRIRAYNEGVAFRYEFKDSILTKTIQNEMTEFNLPAEAVAWASKRAQSPIEKTKVSQLDTILERPLLVQLNDSLFTAIGEAALVDYARMKLMQKKNAPGTLVSELSSEVVLSDVVNKTPWRFVMAADRPGKLLENNYLLLNLNEPNKLTDTSWIIPGKIIRETTLTTKGGMACVDFAVKHKLEYIEFDAGWYGNEYEDASDATTITVDPKRSKGPLDLLGVIEYAKSKDIGVILYVNRRALEKQLDEVLPLLSSWGVSGIKYGFVRVGEQEWTSWLHEAVRKAAEYNIMIDVHDEYRPTGYSRTYPNFMTQEGIRGDEESPKNSMVINTIFTRMIAGAGDQTNCYFAPRVTEEMGSQASQLAKAVCIYSPWQFLYWYDRPEGSVAGAEGAGGTAEFVKEVPELAWYDALPTVWDDTKVLDGYPGELAIIARKSGNDWFVGALSGTSEKEIEIALDFLDDSKTYEATVYSDDANSTSSTNVAIEKRTVSSTDAIGHGLLKQNGLAIHIKAL